MLRIRLSRRGRRNQYHYRLVVAEHAAPIKGKFIEMIGYYNPAKNPKDFNVDTEKVESWIARGAKPTDTVASLLKRYANMENMDQYLMPRDKHRKSKNAPAVEVKQPEAPKAEVKQPEVPAAATAEEKPATE